MTTGSAPIRASAREGSLFSDPEREKARDREVAEDVEHLHGPEEIACGRDKLIVTCLVRNDEPWIRGFIEHHFSLGAAHIVLMDNGSEDKTIEIAKEYDNVTILKTGVTFNTHQLAMERYLIRRFGPGSWVLCLDQDELFDYPYSDVVSLEALLDYLNRNRYSAVVCHMLDMFSNKPLSRVAGDEKEKGMREAYEFYDLFNIQKHDYKISVGDANKVSNEGIKVLRGGIQATLSSVGALLTKHSLMFVDSKIEPKRDSAHWVDNARVADLTGLILHYKFTSSFHDRVVRAIQEKSYAGGSLRYEGFLEALEKNPNMSIHQETSKKLGSVDDLVAEGFLAVSEKYMEWVDEKEAEEAPEEVVRKRPSRLSGAFGDVGKNSDIRPSFGDGWDEFLFPVLSKILLAEQARGEVLEEERGRLRFRVEAFGRSRGLRFLGKLGRLRRKPLGKPPPGHE